MEALDLADIRRQVNRRFPRWSADWRDELAAETALELVGRYHRNPDLDAEPGAVREMAMREAARRFLRFSQPPGAMLPIQPWEWVTSSHVAERQRLVERWNEESAEDALSEWPRWSAERRRDADRATRIALNTLRPPLGYGLENA